MQIMWNYRGEGRSESIINW